MRFKYQLLEEKFVPEKGIEPPLSCLNQILSLARLPIPPPGQKNCEAQI